MIGLCLLPVLLYAVTTRNGLYVKRIAFRKRERRVLSNEDVSGVSRTDNFNGMTRGAGPSPFSITTMKRLLNKIKHKESPKPARQPIRSKQPTDIAAGPSDVPVEVDDTPDGGPNPSYEGPEVDRADLTVPEGEEGEMGSRMVVQDTMDGDQELPASGASISAIAIDGDGHRNQPTSEYS